MIRTATITLVAAAQTGSTFTSWTGCTSASGTTCTVTLAAAAAVSLARRLPSRPTALNESDQDLGDNTVDPLNSIHLRTLVVSLDCDRAPLHATPRSILATASETRRRALDSWTPDGNLYRRGGF